MKKLLIGVGVVFALIVFLPGRAGDVFAGFVKGAFSSEAFAKVLTSPVYWALLIGGLAAWCAFDWLRFKLFPPEWAAPVTFSLIMEDYPAPPGGMTLEKYLEWMKAAGAPEEAVRRAKSEALKAHAQHDGYRLYVRFGKYEDGDDPQYPEWRYGGLDAYVTDPGEGPPEGFIPKEDFIRMLTADGFTRRHAEKMLDEMHGPFLRSNPGPAYFRPERMPETSARV